MPESELSERGRGRPRDSEKDEAIRAAAWEVLARLGYGGLTFEAVAEAAGCTRATLYRRFRSKLDLIVAIFEETSREFEPAALAERAPRDALLGLIEGTALFMAGVRGPALLAIASASTRLPELRAATDAYKVQEREMHWAVFRKLVPTVSEQRLGFVFDSFVGIMLSHVVLSGTRLDARDRDFIADTIVAMLERG